MSDRFRLSASLMLGYLLSFSAMAGDRVGVVGSSTLYPLAKAVAEKASESPEGNDYRIRATGTVAGISKFCAGAGPKYPDILNASRRMRAPEMETCRQSGVNAVVEVKVGYDGISLALSSQGKDFALTARDIYLALAARVPDPSGASRLVPNPYNKWSQVNPSLPDEAIRVLGPPKSSGTRDAFAELAMEAGCGQFKVVRDMTKRDRDRFASVCDSIRTDGAFREAGENDDVIVSELLRDPKLIGIFGFHFLESNKPNLKAATIEGVSPSLQSIADGTYPLARPLFVYFKKANLDRVPGIWRYVQEFTSENAWSEKGYLKKDGLCPMLLEERQKYAYIAENLVDPGCPPFCE
jgi:phosphate transport system substrate-binding protein